jgi:hypothetical protein
MLGSAETKRRDSVRSRSSRPLDLVRDLPTSEEDNEVLRRLRVQAPDPQATLGLLSQLDDAPLEVLAARPFFRGEPFEL